MLKIVSQMLKGMGVDEVTTAGNGRAAIDVFDGADPAPEIVVCDLNMPGSDGFEFMEELGARHFAGGVVLLSGMDSRTLNSATLMGRFHSLNILATLNKPVNEVVLRQTLVLLG
jgi:CheY-like chemotaxis protein